MSDLKQIIDKHLKGIDEDNRSDDSWFPTSDGAEFGRVTKEALTKELTEREAKLTKMAFKVISRANLYLHNVGSNSTMECIISDVKATLKSLGIEGEG